jgi:MFS family permease
MENHVGLSGGLAEGGEEDLVAAGPASRGMKTVDDPSLDGPLIDGPLIDVPSLDGPLRSSSLNGSSLDVPSLGGPADRPLLANRKYLFLMSAQAISNLGDWLYILALFVIVGFRWHGSPITVSIMMLCLTGPMVLLGPFTGVLADKWNRTVMMMVSNVFMAALVGVIPWLPQRWMLFAILVLVGVFQSLFNPAEAGKLKEIVPDNKMQQAASINQSIVQLTKIIGPGMSGFLVAAFGSMSAFWLDAISFILSTLLLLFTGFRAVVLSERSALPAANRERSGDAVANQVSDESTQANQASDDDAVEAVEAVGRQTQPAKQTSRQQFLEGIKYIKRVRILWTGTLILTVALFMVQMTDAQIVTLLRLIPNASSGLMGMIMGLSGVGGLIAALLVGVLKWKSAIRLMSIGTTGMGIGLGATALIAQHESAAGAITPVWMVIIVFMSILIGLCAGLTFIPFQAAAQQNTPSELTGRVFGTIGSLTTAAALLGPALGGVIVTFAGVVNAYLATGIALVVIGVAALLLRGWLEGRTRVSASAATSQHWE